MPAIVQINFHNDISEEELAQTSNPERAKMFWNVDGLRWKVWLRDAERRESGGIYLFATRAAAEAYVSGPIAAAIKTLPHTSAHSIKLFDVRDDVSAITGAPLDVDMKRG